MSDSPKKRIHFIGMGGIGMSGIAEVLLDQGHLISGSDLNSSPLTDRLQNKGARFFKGHSASQVEGADLIVFSSAVNPNNPEWKRAQELNLPCIKRGEMLARLMDQKRGVAIAGSHGKTTTSSLLATLFTHAGVDPSYIIGGIIQNLGGNAHAGSGELMIAEADESDGSFLLLNPQVIALTNIDDDHIDHYGSKEKIIKAFSDFLNKTIPMGTTILNGDDKISRSFKKNLPLSVLWYGLENKDCHYFADEISYSASGTSFVLIHNQERVGIFRSRLIGRHNVSNTLAAVATAHSQGLPWNIIDEGLDKFSGVGRRLEQIYQHNQFTVIDDYGHHPTEIRATLSALKQVDHRELTVIFEPHRYSRTRNFWDEFIHAFDGADELFLSPIYAASEEPIEGITSERLVQEIQQQGIRASYLPSLEGMKELLKKKQASSGIFLTLGAGAISKKIREQVKDL